jgi:hypothetical protein
MIIIKIYNIIKCNYKIFLKRSCPRIVLVQRWRLHSALSDRRHFRPGGHFLNQHKTVCTVLGIILLSYVELCTKYHPTATDKN